MVNKMEMKKVKIEVEGLIEFYQEQYKNVNMNINSSWVPIFEGIDTLRDTIIYLQQLVEEGIEYI